jgi:AAA+ superfamily predicted ATPase|tara:strand:+ start:547 stop:1773 length:1227 start_codon:yes stop_codon:yes gene_type:complete
MKKLYQVTFVNSINSYTYLSLFKKMHNENIITGYCFDFSYSLLNYNNVVFYSNKDINYLQEYLHLNGISAFHIVEIKNSGGYLNQNYWDWEKNSGNLEVIATVSIDNNEEVELFDEIEKEFQKIIGLNGVKDDVRKFQQHLKIMVERKKRNLKSANISLHAVFTGSPGTGKTTFARIIGKIYKEIGILKKGHVVEVDRGDLVAGFIGQTAKKTKEKLNEAIDGVLFIDEAYSLSRGVDDSKDFGNEVIETVLKFMEDNRDRISVIVAGYDKEMDRFINSNPGLKSRFTKYYHFPDYSPIELLKLFKLFLDNDDYSLHASLDKYMLEFFKQYKRKTDPASFGNGRSVRNIFEEVIMIQSQRISVNKDYESKADIYFKKIILADVKKLFLSYNYELYKSRKSKARNTRKK